MISVLILTLDDAEALTRLLTALVPAAVDGLVTDVTVFDRGSTDGTLDIADDAGASIVRAGEAHDATAAARGAWLMILPAAARLGHDWRHALEQRLAHDPRPEPTSLTEPGRGLLAAFGGRRPGGWLVARRLAPPLASAGAVEAYLLGLERAGGRGGRLQILAGR